MAIDPKLLVIKPVDELAEVTGLQPGSMLFYDGSNNLKRISIDTFNNLSKTAKPLKPTDPTPTDEGLYMPTESGTYANADGLIAQEGYYTLFFFDGINWTKSETLMPIDEETKDKLDGLTIGVPTNQIFDKSTAQIEVGAVFPYGLVVSNHNFRVRMDNLIIGNQYTISGGSDSSLSTAKVLFFDSSDNIISFIQTTDSNNTNCTFTIPPICDYVYFQLGYLDNANTYPLRDNPVVNTVMLNAGAVALPYESYGEDYRVSTDKLDKEILIKVPKKNLLDVADTDFSVMYSPGSKTIRTNVGEEYVATPPIAVKQGVFYAWNGDNSGGYFENEINMDAIDNIQFVRPVDNIGWTFQIPLNSDIKFVRLNMLRVGTSGNTLADDYQLEEGEKTSAYVPFELVEVFNPLYLPNNSTNEGDLNILEKLTDINAVTKLNHNYLPNFFKHSALKDKNVVVAMVGTSLTARTTEHCTDHVDAKERPPMMQSNNMASHLWDALKWDSQFYRRYDSEFFTESGSWSEASNLANWDDGAYRAGLTKYSDSNGSNFSFQIPVKAWQFNLIFRSDSLGTENAVINISQGNGEVQVFNENSQTWVEANGFVFSQKQSKVILPTVTIPDAQDEIDYTISNFEIGGNTTYQKRLKMRCKGAGFDSRNTVKDVTISRTSGRLIYWGVEWSVREFMITLVNSARGSFGMRLKDQVLGLTSKQENEVWSFKPDLILTENPLHNTGAGTEPNSNYSTDYWGKITDDFFFGNNPVSFKTRATVNGLNPEFLIYTSSTIGIDLDGSLKVGTDKNGKSYTSLESFSMANQFLKDNYPDVLAINSCNYWVWAGNASFPNLRLATDGSTKSGGTFTTDGQHWNDVGGKIIAMTILPYLNFE